MASTDTATTTTSASVLRSAADGGSKSKQDQRKKVNSFFAEFLNELRKERPRLVGTGLDDCIEADLDTEFFDKYVAYLEDRQPALAFTTAKNYFSTTKLALCLRFSGLNEVFAVRNKGWQQHIKKHKRNVCHEERRPMIQHHIPMTYADLHYICQTFFSNDMHEECCLQALDWANCGRISEGQDIRWSDIKVVQDNSTAMPKCCLQMHWFHDKTSTLSAPHSFVGMHWQSCVFHNLARLIALLHRPDLQVLPSLKTWNVVSHMNGKYKELYKAWEAEYHTEEPRRAAEEEAGVFSAEPLYVMSKNLTTHGTRAGSNQHCQCVNIPKQVMEGRMGLSSEGSTIGAYNSVSWEGDSEVIVCYALLGSCCAVHDVTTLLCCTVGWAPTGGLSGLEVRRRGASPTEVHPHRRAQFV